MTARLVVDTNAVVDLLRSDRRDPPQLDAAEVVFLPIPVLGELLVGAYLSDRREENLRAAEELEISWVLLKADSVTARHYASVASAELRAFRTGLKTEYGRKNDLWIAALCLQHDLPLLTNDHDFDRIEGLQVIHW